MKELSAEGDPLEKLTETVDFELFRSFLARAVRRSHRSKGGRPGFDPVLKFKMLVLLTLHGLSVAQTSYMVRDRLSWMRFCGLGPGDTVPDANTLWDFREALIAARALDEAFERLDRAIGAAGYLPMGGPDHRCHAGRRAQAAQYEAHDGLVKPSSDDKRSAKLSSTSQT